MQVYRFHTHQNHFLSIFNFFAIDLNFEFQYSNSTVQGLDVNNSIPLKKKKHPHEMAMFYCQQILFKTIWIVFDVTHWNIFTKISYFHCRHHFIHRFRQKNIKQNFCCCSILVITRNNFFSNELLRESTHSMRYFWLEHL